MIKTAFFTVEFCILHILNESKINNDKITYNRCPPTKDKKEEIFKACLSYYYFIKTTFYHSRILYVILNEWKINNDMNTYNRCPPTKNSKIRRNLSNMFIKLLSVELCILYRVSQRKLLLSIFRKDWKIF